VEEEAKFSGIILVFFQRLSVEFESWEDLVDLKGKIARAYDLNR